MDHGISYEDFKSLLIEFFEEEGCFSQYMKNCDFLNVSLELNSKTIERTTYFFYDEYNSIKSVFSAAFCWDETPEGYEYWGRISQNWCNTLRDFELNQ